MTEHSHSVSLFHDSAFGESRGKPWCVRYSHDDTVWRFETFERAVKFLGHSEYYLLPKAWNFR